MAARDVLRKHRQRVKDIIEALCNKLLDDQALLKVLSQSSLIALARWCVRVACHAARTACSHSPARAGSYVGCSFLLHGDCQKLAVQAQPCEISGIESSELACLQAQSGLLTRRMHQIPVASDGHGSK